MRFDPTALMGNNPMIQLINTMRGGGDPTALVNQLIQNHPQRDQLRQIIGGKTPEQLMQTAENMCRERGVSVDDILRRYGITR